MPTSTTGTALVASALVAAASIVIALTPYTGPTTITTCQTIQDKTITGGLDIRVSNGNHGPYATEADAQAAACVKLIDVVIAPTSWGNGDAAVDDLYAGSGACANGGGQCGPVYMADSEIQVGDASSGYTYGMKYGNVSVWRSTIHLGPQGISCGGYCDIHDSYLSADSSDAAGTTHMDGFISNGNSGRGMVLDHNVIGCYETKMGTGTTAGCSAPVGLFGDQSPITNVSVTNNYFIHTASGHYCSYSGASQPAKAFPTGANIVWQNNTYDAATCKHANGYLGPIADWANNTGNVLCGNRFSDGTTAGFPVQSAGCPVPKPLPVPPPLPGTTPSSTTSSTTTVPATTTTSAATTTVPPTTVPAVTTVPTTVPVTTTTERQTVICTSPPLVCKVSIP